MVKVAMVQMGSTENKSENLGRAIKYAEDAVKQGAELIVYDELFGTQYFPAAEDNVFFDEAEPEDGPTVRKFIDFAKKNSVAFVVTIFEEDKKVRGTFYDTAIIIGKDGEVKGKYRKAHIPQLNGYYEKFYWRPGAGYPVFDMGDYTLGCVICYDRHFPEGPRALALKGADIVVIPTTTNFYPELWELELRSHASYNTIFVVGVNRTKENFRGKDIAYLGRSLVAGPSGDIIHEMSEKEGVAVVDVDLKKITERRKKAPFLADRKPSNYEDLVFLDIGDVALEP